MEIMVALGDRLPGQHIDGTHAMEGSARAAVITMPFDGCETHRAQLAIRVVGRGAIGCIGCPHNDGGPGTQRLGSQKTQSLFA